MKTLHVLTANEVAVLVKRVFKLERCGKYEKAIGELVDIWPDFLEPPQVEGFEPELAGELLLRCGSLIGFHGHNSQLQFAQDRSRDLLMAARSRFVSLENTEKIAECENYLALSYWRTGEQNEAQIWIEESFSRDLSDSNLTRLFSHIIQSLINGATKQYGENLTRLRNLETAFLECDDECLKGDFYNHCGLAFKNLGNIAEALHNFELAKYYHKRSRHKIYLGTVENNLAQLYKETGRFSKAHEAIDNATQLFRQIKDRTREGFSLDTKALVYFAESKFDEALRTVDKALSILKKSENSTYIVETLLTKAKVLIFLDNFSDAVMSLIDAVNIARVQTGADTAKRLIDEFETALIEKNSSAAGKNLEVGDFELILPGSIAQFGEYRGVWINNTMLEGVGLTRGSLAIIVEADVNRGDLIALSELETDEVSCGFYDADFGIVCLEGTSGEPLIFDEDNTRILGKIVGVCNSGKREDGKMVVSLLNL